MRGPKFSVGSQGITSIAADPVDPRRVAVGNGDEVQSTEDAGCTWTKSIPQQGPYSGMTVVGHQGSSVRALWQYIVIMTASRQGSFLLKVSGADGASTWTADLPPQLATYECSTYLPCLVRFAPNTGLGIGYASSTGPLGGLHPAMARTADGGRTWAVIDRPGSPGNPHVTDLVIDPADPDHLFAVATRTVYETRGDWDWKWRPVKTPWQVSSRARLAWSDGPVVVDTSEDNSKTVVLVSHDGGQSFVDSGLWAPVGPAVDAAVGPTPSGPSLHVVTGGALYRHDPAKGLVALVGRDAGVAQVSPTATGLWASSGALLFVGADPATADVPDSQRYRPPEPRRVRRAGDVRATAGGGTLRVGERVAVPPGGSAATVVSGGLARQPRGIDVFFLMDTTGSMAAKIAPMAGSFASVVDALNQNGIAARFGLGEYGDIAFRYRRHADLDASPAEVQEKLSKLTATGGDEFHYTAFYQLATGEGMSSVTSGGKVPPGLQTSFEPGALHVVVHATDDIDQNDPNGPPEATALHALRAVDARHVGILPYDSPAVSPSAVPGVPESDYSTDPRMVALRRYAEQTGTFAPAGGIDCDGDGDIDLAEGKPIACAINGATSADAPIATLLTRVLLALTSRQPVGLRVGPTPVGVQVAPLGDYSAVDLHEAHDDLEFRLSVTCPADMYGSVVDVPLELHVDGVAVAQAPLPVECLAAPKPPRLSFESTARPIPPRVVGLVPPAAQAPPALAPSVAQASAEATSSASSSAHAAQVGMAAAPDDVVEVVRAEAGGDDELRFVAARHRPAAPVVPAAGLAFVVALGVLRLVVKPRVAEQRSRSW